MRARTVVALGLSGLAACSSGKGDPLADDLKRDLEASASRIELANQGQAQPMRFVSELEQGKATVPVERSRTPRRVAAQTAGVVPENQTSPTPEAAEEIQVAQATESPQAPEPTPEVSSVPMVAPRPSSLPVDVPTDGGRGYSGGGVGTGDHGTGIGIGDVIGVVIRGGGVGPDHCPPRRRPRGRIFNP